jgi:hypothetical protein
VNEVPESHLMELAQMPWPWHIPCSFIHDLSGKGEYETKKQSLLSRMHSIASSPYSDAFPTCEAIPEVKLKERVIEVFHLVIGPKSIHCIAKIQTSIKKRNGEHKYAYKFCYHHAGHCPHSKPKIKLIRKHV